MGIFARLFGKRNELEDRVVNIMLSMVVHPRDHLITKPSNIRDWSEQTLQEEHSNLKLAPNAKTGVIMAPGLSVDEAKNDLPEQLQIFMRMNGLDFEQYDTQCFTLAANARDDVTFVWITAFKRIEGNQDKDPSKNELDFFQYPKEFIPENEGYCSDMTCPCDDTAIQRGSGYLFISEDAAVFLTAAKKDASLLNQRGVPVPILICKQSATVRGIDLDVANADAKRWWKGGQVPLRATP
jgi:ribosomal protein L24E